MGSGGSGSSASVFRHEFVHVVKSPYIPTYIYTHSHVHTRTHIHTAKNKTSTEKYVDRYNEWKNEVICVVEAEKD